MLASRYDSRTLKAASRSLLFGVSSAISLPFSSSLLLIRIILIEDGSARCPARLSELFEICFKLAIALLANTVPRSERTTASRVQSLGRLVFLLQPLGEITPEFETCL